MHILNVAPISLEGMAKQRRSAGSLRQSDQNFKLWYQTRTLLAFRLVNNQDHNQPFSAGTHKDQCLKKNNNLVM